MVFKPKLLAMSKVSLKHARIFDSGLGHIWTTFLQVLARSAVYHWVMMSIEVEIAELRQWLGLDARVHVCGMNLRAARHLLHTAAIESDLGGCGVFIVTVPAPAIASANRPDLRPLEGAVAEAVGRHLSVE